MRISDVGIFCSRRRLHRDLKPVIDFSRLSFPVGDTELWLFASRSMVLDVSVA
jgi:hypothetical protein